MLTDLFSHCVHGKSNSEQCSVDLSIYITSPKQPPGGKVCVLSTIKRWTWAEIRSVKVRFSVVLFITVIENFVLYKREN
jgi:hypothetical protein